MAYDIFEDWSIIPMPASPALKSVTFSATDTIGRTQALFTGQSRFQQWPGADLWELDIILPPMKRASANAWIAWMMSLRGMLNVFQIGDPLGKIPRGTPSGTPVFNGLHLATATTINTKGWTASATGLLLPGDYIQIGYRLHVVAGVSPIDASGTGTASIEIWPSLREAVADNVPIATSNCKGLFRLSDNKRSWSVDETRTWGIAFKATEAR